MVPVSLYDEIEISRPRTTPSKSTARQTVEVTCDHPLVPDGRKNIAFLAASSLLGKKGIKDPVAIHIRKRIPVGGGLGGGSSDAAATLRGLDRLFRLDCSSKELFLLSRSLGADVPFFIHGRPVRARGVGDQLSPLVGVPPIWLVIVYPGFPVSTRWVYEHFRVKLTKPIENTSINFLGSTPDECGKFLVNELEAVTLARYPRISNLKKKLIQSGASGALMSGTGSSVFGIFTSRPRAKKALGRLRKEKGVQAFLVRVLS